MKTDLLKTSAALAVALALLATPAFAKDSIETSSIKTSLAAATPVELPSKAAGLIAAASDKERAAVTVAVVQIAVKQNPSAAPAIVGAIAQKVPAMASLAAVTAASAQKKQLAQIAQAASAAAPSQAAQIVSALIREFPSHYAVIADAVAKGAPAAGKEILAAVGESVPALQAPIQANVASFGTSAAPLPVDAILDKSAQTVTSTTFTPAPAPAVQTIVQGPPTIKPPFTPLPPSPPQINNSQTSPEQPGGRNYASP